jgi:hypothetical protein
MHFPESLHSLRHYAGVVLGEGRFAAENCSDLRHVVGDRGHLRPYVSGWGLFEGGDPQREGGVHVNPDWAAYIALGFWVLIPSAIWLGRKWLMARVEKGVQHSFDIKIASVKGDLRQAEERLKSDLRNKEAEISLLRTSVLSGHAGRQSLVDKRRFEAVERIWTAVNDLSGHKMLASMVAMLRLENVAKQISDPKMQQFVAMLEKLAPTKGYKNVARDERPFIPELAWAYFLAYSVTIVSNCAVLLALKAGIVDPPVDSEALKKILLAALPHRLEFIEKHDPKSYYFLLDELEELLLAELRKILDGTEADQTNAARAKAIMVAVQELNEKSADLESAGMA